MTTPLLEALGNNRTEVAKILLEAGADTNRRDRCRSTALSYAGECGDKDIIETLLARGLDVNETNYQGFTCLHRTIFSTLDRKEDECFEIFRRLVTAGADLSSNNVGGISALQCACDSGSKAFAKELLEIGPKEEINIEGAFFGTPLYAAAFRGRVEIVKMLLDAGADINRGRNGESPFEAARAEDHQAVIELLKKRGASAAIDRTDMTLNGRKE